MVKPLLAQFAVTRGEDAPLEGYYDASQSLWVLNSGQPLIDAGKRMAELCTKSQSGRETEDDKSLSFLELMTKTKNDREQDDAGHSYLLELMTKTDTVRERDDQ